MTSIAKAGRRNVSELKPHPDNAKIYGDTATGELVESIRTKGILSPYAFNSGGR